MKSFGARAFDLAGLGNASGRWLLLGKGPSFAKYSEPTAAGYDVCALNHAMRGLRVLVGHAVDIEVFEHLSLDDIQGVQYLCAPWIPHTRQKRPFYSGASFFGPGRLTLDEHLIQNKVLAEYARAGRLLTYNLSTVAPLRHRSDLPTVQGNTFSAAVAFSLLATAGAREIRTLGVDGGNAYGAAFVDLEKLTKLQTAQTSFDSQFAEIAMSRNIYKPLAGPLDVECPARVYVGCMPEQELAYRVLEYSIHRHSSISVEVERLHEAVAEAKIEIPTPQDPRNAGRTPFSYQRFAIPKIRNHTGRAIYVDSDMLVFRDLRELWMTDMQGLQMLSAATPSGSTRRPQFSVMLIDCAGLRWDVKDIVAGIDEGRWSYESLMFDMRSVEAWEARLPHHWNSLESYEANVTSLLHFTDMDGQPWLNALHPQNTLWSSYLLDAVAEGHISPEWIAEEVKKGNVRPSLLAQIERRQPDARQLPFAVLAQDVVRFFPPHRRQASAMSRLKHEIYRVRKYSADIASNQLWRPAAKRIRRLASSVASGLSR